MYFAEVAAHQERKREKADGTRAVSAQRHVLLIHELYPSYCSRQLTHSRTTDTC